MITLKDGGMSWVVEHGSKFVGLVHGEITTTTDMNRIFYAESFTSNISINSVMDLITAIGTENNMVLTQTLDDGGKVCYEWRTDNHAGYCRMISQCIEDRWLLS